MDAETKAPRGPAPVKGSYIRAFAYVNGQRIEVHATGDQAKVDAALRSFTEQLAASIAKNVTIEEVKPKRKAKRTK